MAKKTKDKNVRLLDQEPLKDGDIRLTAVVEYEGKLHSCSLDVSGEILQYKFEPRNLLPMNFTKIVEKLNVKFIQEVVEPYQKNLKK